MTSVAPQTSSRKPKVTSPRIAAPRKKSIPSGASVPPRPPELQAPASTAPHPPGLAVPYKQSQLISLLQRPVGATLTELINATGWQAHSVRGVISGVLRKKLGLTVICEPPTESGERLYRIVSPVVPA